MDLAAPSGESNFGTQACFRPANWRARKLGAVLGRHHFTRVAQVKDLFHHGVQVGQQEITVH